MRKQILTSFYALLPAHMTASERKNCCIDKTVDTATLKTLPLVKPSIPPLVTHLNGDFTSKLASTLESICI